MSKNMEEDIWKPPAEGDLIWQQRMPGGTCIFLDAYPVQEGDRYETYYRVLHPIEGLINDPAYYYSSIEEAIEYGKKQLTWENEQWKKRHEKEK